MKLVTRSSSFKRRALSSNDTQNRMATNARSRRTDILVYRILRLRRFDGYTAASGRLPLLAPRGACVVFAPILSRLIGLFVQPPSLLEIQGVRGTHARHSSSCAAVWAGAKASAAARSTSTIFIERKRNRVGQGGMEEESAEISQSGSGARFRCPPVFCATLQTPEVCVNGIWSCCLANWIFVKSRNTLSVVIPASCLSTPESSYVCFDQTHSILGVPPTTATQPRAWVTLH
ncbi:hypothetical protein B0H11DRAFT_1937922 [Mycena galericulata]|nr:hypothetical protein B0H11DRAFT_1937922 [Mycena galericulata]